MNQQILAISYF